ncbi:GNAT family N-acetyltransferase [Lentibacillus sp. N15]|uniref:GNAT family N-acetyltransferase n=1 Tax=Lentibacillus songyuanensis TaxID=3136161 RepID=UPI0031BB86C6
MVRFIPLKKNRLKALTALWNRHLGDEFPMTETLFEQNSFKDKNVCFKSSLIAVDEKDFPIGFIITKRWQENLDIAMSETTGWIQILLVDQEVRGQGIGSRLLNHAESELVAEGAKQILLGKDPYHYFPGIPGEYQETAKWFERRGYVHTGNEYDLMREYTIEEGKILPELDGVEFALLEKQGQHDFLAFLHRCFPGRWEYEAIHYFRKGGTGREFMVLKKNDRIIGFCRINDGQSPYIAQNVYWSPLFKEELGGAGPLGIDANERGQGYGLAIVEAGLAFLRQRNIRRIVIDWTGLVDFYKKLGYHPWKSYLSYQKEI